MSVAALEHKGSSTAPDVGLLGADDTTGVVEAIVSVTGVIDHDNDVIEPGSYAKTLKSRRPKGIFVHDWGRWVARTEHIEELLPGDPRLPSQTKDGKPWPGEAGGLYVKARFNLGTREGKDAYENVKFFSETGECEWSVGYRVPPGKSAKDKTGVRRIKEIDLFEYSPVLFGANSLSGTLAVKSLDGPARSPEDPDPFVDGEDDEQVVAELDAAANDVADDDIPQPPADDQDETADGEQGDDEEADADPQEDPQAPQGEADPADAEDAEDGDSPADATDGEAKGSSASLDRSPRKNWVEKAGDLPAYIREIARSIHEKRGMPLEQAIPIAIATVKKWAAGGDTVNPDTRAKAAKAVAQWEALKAKSKRGKTAPPDTVESTLFPYLPGTYEELREQIRQEAAKALPDARHIEVMGTWPGHTVVTCYTADGVTKAYEIPYSITIGDETTSETVTLHEPEPVELLVSVDDGQEEAGEKMLPFPSMIEDATAGLKAWITHTDTKAGRVLSAVNERRLLGAVESLVAVLKAAGLEIDTRPKQSDDEPATDVVMAVDSTAPSARPDVTGKTLIDPALLARGYRITAEATERRITSPE